MNKLFTRIMASVAGFAMAIGVGVGVAANDRKATELNAAGVSDTIDGTTCSSWKSATTSWHDDTYVGANSGLTYTAHYMGGNNNSDGRTFAWNTNGYLYVSGTTSRELVSVTITTAANTKTVNVYASNTAYTGAPTGSTLTALSATTSGATYNFTGSYKYLALKGAASSTFIKSIVIVYSEESSTPELGLSKDNISVSKGEDSTFIVSATNLTSNFSISGGNDTFFTTSYTPSSENGNHIVTLHGVEVTNSPITLTVSSTGATSKTISVSVVNAVYYEKVIAASDIKAGREIIIGSSDGEHLLGKYLAGNNCPAFGNIPNADGKLIETNLPEDFALFTIGGESGAWTLTDQESRSYYGTSNQNYLKAGSDDTWSINISAQGVATITSAASTRIIKYNNTNDIFGTYASGQTDVSIYMIPTLDPEIQVTINGSQSLGVGETTTLSATKINGATGTINWVSSNNSILSLSSSTGDEVVVTAGSTLGEATITASLTGCDDVVTSFKVRKGSITHPYTIAEAVEAINGSDPLAKVNVYVSGFVSQVDSLNSDDSITYWISDDGTTTNQFQVYKGKGIGGASFESVDDIEDGFFVKVFGNIKKYVKDDNTTYEFEQGSQLVTCSETYTVTFDSNGGSSVPSQKIIAGEKVAEPTNPTKDPDEENTYTFAGWFTIGDEEYDFNSAVNQSFTLYARWNAIPVPAHQIIENSLSTSASLTYSDYDKNTSDTVVADTLTRETTGRTTQSYGDWTYTSGTSGISYKGNSAGDKDSIQLRSNNDNSGIVVTTNANNKVVKKITVVWNGNTANTRTLDFYGKGTAYSSASELYDDNSKGSAIGSLVLNDNEDVNELTQSIVVSEANQFKFIGIRSYSGAQYVTSIEIEWGDAPTYSFTNLAIRFKGQITKTLWDRLENESDITGYGILFTANGFTDLEDWYDSSVNYTSNPNPKSEIVNYTNVRDLPNLTNDTYGWSLRYAVADVDYKTTFTAVAYIVTDTDGVVFMEEKSVTVKDLAAGLITDGTYQATDFGGSLNWLATR